MTKAKAMELMLEHDREVIDPGLARKIARAFDTTLKELAIRPQKVSSFYRINYSEETKNLSAVSTHKLAKQLAIKKYSKTVSAKEADGYQQELVELGFHVVKFNPLHTDEEVKKELPNWYTVEPVVESRMNGVGSYAEDITKKAIEILKK